MISKWFPRAILVCLCRVTFVVGLLVPATGRAQPQPSTATERELKAHRHFSRALEFADQQAYPEALVELERARAAAPHYALLYNIGQIYVALGRPKKAIEAFSEYLAQGGDRLSADRRDQVQTAIQLMRGRLGYLELTVEPQGAVLYIDGERVGRTPLSALELGAGIHHVVVRKQGHEPAERRIALRGGERLTLRLTLEPEPVAPDPGQLVVFCGVPDVRLTVDGSPMPLRAQTSSLSLHPGAHRLEFFREGYVSRPMTLHVRSGLMQTAACSITPLLDLPRSSSGELVVEPSQADARIEVDGRPVQPMHGARWPVGRHRVTVTRFGYEPWESVVTLNAGMRTTVPIRLEPTEDMRRERSAVAAERRTWAYGMGAGALALGSASVVLAVVAHRKMDAYLAEQNEIDQLLFSGRGTESMISRQQANDRRFDSAHTLQLLAVGLGAGAVASAAAATVLYLLTHNDDTRDGAPLEAARYPWGWSFAW